MLRIITSTLDKYVRSKIHRRKANFRRMAEHPGGPAGVVVLPSPERGEGKGSARGEFMR